MKIIFLDIDGVLNHFCPHSPAIDWGCVSLLNGLVSRNNAKVVICSTWRELIFEGSMTLEGFRYLMQTHGLWAQCIIDHTRADDPSDPNDFLRRGAQVAAWLERNPQVTSFVAIDDNEWGYREANIPLVQTDPSIGLCERDVQLAERILRSFSVQIRPLTEASGPVRTVGVLTPSGSLYQCL